MPTDPTRSKTRRDQFTRQYRKRWRTVRGEIRKELSGDSYYRPQNGVSESRQVADFRDFLENLVNEELLEPVSQRGARNGTHYSATQLDELYRHGIRQGMREFERAGFDVPDVSAEAISRTDSHREMRRAMYLRTYQDLEDAANATVQSATREYRRAVREGASVNEAVAAVNDRVDKVGRYRTDLVAQSKSVETLNHAALQLYADGGNLQVAPMPETGVANVTVDGEPVPEDYDFQKGVRTAGDRRVCAECRSIASSGPYSVSEVRNDQSLIPPYHPNCRCFLFTLPLGDGNPHPEVGFGVRRGRA